MTVQGSKANASLIRADLSTRIVENRREATSTSWDRRTMAMTGADASRRSPGGPTVWRRRAVTGLKPQMNLRTTIARDPKHAAMLLTTRLRVPPALPRTQRGDGPSIKRGPRPFRRSSKRGPAPTSPKTSELPGVPDGRRQSNHSSITNNHSGSGHTRHAQSPPITPQKTNHPECIIGG